jgi:tRNA-2-methylthio-N6-dimethylallyladenosine synthase
MYSERPGTLAAKRFKDDIHQDIKRRRLQEIVSLQNKLSFENYSLDIGKTHKILIEGNSKRSDNDWMGRNSQNKVVVFPKAGKDLKPGDYAFVQINECTQGTLLGTLID